MRALPLVLVLLSLMASLSLAAPKKVVAYVPNWIDLKAFAKTIDYAKITHINIAFENPDNDAGDMSWEAPNDVLITEAHRHGVKVQLSIGGGSASSDPVLQKRYASLLTQDKRATFAAKLAAVVKEHQLDGLDVDIEGPSIDKNYGPFIDELAALLKPAGKLLTAALSEGYGGSHVPDSVFTRLDFLNIMAYDETGSWEPQNPGQHSSLEFAKASVAYFVKRGLPKEKAVLGVPFYGYGFGKAFLKQSYGYADILKKYPAASQQDEVGNTIWHNSIPTIRKKARLILNEDLGGIMIWSLDNDAKGETSLLSAIHAVLSPATKSEDQ